MTVNPNKELRILHLAEGEDYHFDDGATDFENDSYFISSFYIDELGLAFRIKELAGATRPPVLWSKVSLQVGFSGSIETFASKDLLIARLKEIRYIGVRHLTPNDATSYTILKKGMVVFWGNVDNTFISDNFYSGVGINDMTGWDIFSTNGKFIMPYDAFAYPDVTETGGFANTVLLKHKHGIPFNGVAAGLSGSGHNTVTTDATRDESFDTAETNNEDGVGKNIPPFTVQLFVIRNVDLVIYGNGNVASTPNLSQVLNVGDRFFKQTSDSVYTSLIEDTYFYTALDNVDEIQISANTITKINSVLFYSAYNKSGVLTFTDGAEASYNGMGSLSSISYDLYDEIMIKNVGSGLFYVAIVNKSSGGVNKNPINIKAKYDISLVTVPLGFVINRIVSLNDTYTDFVGIVTGTELTITSGVFGDIYLIDGYTT